MLNNNTVNDLIQKKKIIIKNHQPPNRIHLYICGLRMDVVLLYTHYTAALQSACFAAAKHPNTNAYGREGQ